MGVVKLGVIGCGIIGKVHLKFATSHPMAEVVAVADIVEEKAKEAATQFGIPKVYSDPESLLRGSEIDGLILAFQTSGRAEVALKVFAHGKHVLIEKPVAMNAEEVKKMLAAKGNLIAGCCSCRYRFLPSFNFVKSFLESGALGQIRLIRIRTVKPDEGPPKILPPAWRLKRDLNGGGILMNWGCYDLDYLFALFNWQLKPKWVVANAWKIPPPFEPHVAPNSDAETHITALLLCEDGLTISYERGEYMPTAYEEGWEIIGEKGSLRFRMTPERFKTVNFYEASTEAGVMPKIVWQGEENWDTVHEGVIDDFVRAILEGRQPATSLEQAFFVQKLTDTIYESAFKNEPVRFQI
ncbi:MAG: Gfo/Idh/MocA family oxidoreductase [Armatimonadetes bacterium]|nr:Gfo/Idh/MocA family oxidoreductase [Armatimonadota bacterium]MDW8028821.1 Gfo/Idh/MocA family oxidoreductase [Armatimonadota bacterium]